MKNIKKIILMVLSLFMMLSSFVYSYKIVVINDGTTHPVTVTPARETGTLVIGPEGSVVEREWVEEDSKVISLGGIAAFQGVGIQFSKPRRWRMGGAFLRRVGWDKPIEVSFPSNIGKNDLVLVRIKPGRSKPMVAVKTYRVMIQLLYKDLKQINAIEQRVKMNLPVTTQEEHDQFVNYLEFLDEFNRKYRKFLDGDVSFANLKEKIWAIIKKG